MQVAGLDVRFGHYPKGHPYMTQCFVYCGPGMLYMGAAFCSPHDNFDRRIGRKLAFTRAIADFPREQRRELWREFLQKCKV